MRVDFVIPVFRNEGSIKITFDNLKQVFQEQLSDFDYRVIFVNDGSDDGSLAEIEEIHRNNSNNVKVISFSRNFGQVPALVAGFKKADGDMVINLSADLQEPSELVLKMVKQCQEGHKIVICHRVNRNDSKIVNFTSNIFYSLINFFNPSIPKGGFDTVLLAKEAVTQFNKISERNRFYQGDIMFLGYAIKYIPYERLERTIGTSQWNITKKIKYFIDGLLNTSYLPIRIMSVLGILFSFFGFFYGSMIVIERLFFDTPFKGYTPIIVLVSGIGGLIMIMLGVIGEYIWRIYDEVRGKPYYIIEKEY